MKTILRIIVVLGATISLAMAGDGTEASGNGLLVFLFLGFGAVIIVFQLIPGLMLFSSMIKGFFTKSLNKPYAGHR
jgi:hypothetical protein